MSALQCERTRGPNPERPERISATSRHSVKTLPAWSVTVLVHLGSLLTSSPAGGIINTLSYRVLLSLVLLLHGPLTHFTVPVPLHCPTLIKAVTLLSLCDRDSEYAPGEEWGEKSTGIKFQCNCLLNCGLQLLKFYPWFCVTAA